MTVSESIIEWLQGFEKKRIDTDIQKAGAGSYALVKEPVQNIKSYISGRKEYTDHYTISACLPSQTNADRIANNGFGEKLSDWVKEMNDKKSFPQIKDALVNEIAITTPFYMGATSTNDSVYEMTIAIKYEKR